MIKEIRMLMLLASTITCFCDQLHSQGKIVITAQLPDNYNGDSAELEYYPVNTPDIKGGHPEKHLVRKNVENNHVKWVIPANSVHYLYSSILPMQWGVAEPGDSIQIRVDNQVAHFSGKGSNNFKLLYELNSIKHKFEHTSDYKSLPHKSYSTVSLKEYLFWNECLNRKQQMILPAVDAYKDKISPSAYQVIRDLEISEIEKIRVSKFYSMMLYSIWENSKRQPNKKFGLSATDLLHICDSTLYGPAARWLQDSGQTYNNYFVSFNRVEVYKKEGFTLNDNINSKSERDVLYYNHAKHRFKGITRELLLIYLVSYPIYKRGFTIENEMMLADYFQQSGFPKYKRQIGEYVEEVRQKRLEKGWIAPHFVLTDAKGKLFTKEDIKGKIALLDFWFTGCVGCSQMTPALSSVEAAFKNDTNVVFLSISIDKNREQWLKSIDRKKYTTGGGINLYTGGAGNRHPMLKQYNISSYPNLYLVDAYGKIVQNPVPNPVADNGKELINIIRKQLTLLHDGPFVLHCEDSITAYSIKNFVVSELKFCRKTTPVLNVQTDEPGETFDVPLKSNMGIEPSEFPQPEKILAISDIEGNFTAFRKLLQANEVIDREYNWTFGKGHLVLNGDMFDRGEQVTECLWLIYSLEEKAKASGGYVHFILGNHEIMNLNGDVSYVQQKYKGNIALLKKDYANELYGEHSEIGRWLRTKNIVEKIGNDLFVHGGISEEIAQLELTIKQINDIARPYYAKDTIARRSEDRNLNMLYDWKKSPFWCRDYYDDNDGGKRKPSIEQLDSILNKFDVDHIITGHTVVGKNISVHYGGRVINTDTRHAAGASEALIIQSNRYYRANDLAERFLLMNNGEYFTRK